jgi:hypothetical protein
LLSSVSIYEWPILLPGNGQNAGFYTIYPRAFSGHAAVGHLASEVAGELCAPDGPLTNCVGYQ